MGDRDFPHASLIEGLRFTAQVAVPNVIQGLFRRRRQAVAAATLAGADGLAVGFMKGLRRSYGDGPVWIRVGKDESLLLLGDEPIKRVLGESPEPFAADPEPKRTAMSHFQPYALTISREPEWRDRRAFTEAVLDTGRPVHRLGDRFAAVCAQESATLPAELDWEAFNEMIRRIARRVILGDGAAEDRELSQMLGELMDKSNPPGKGDPGLHDRFLTKLEAHVQRAQAGSLAGLFRDAPQTDRTQPAGQAVHWLFALGDTLAANAYRCLAVLAADHEERGRALSEVDGAHLDTGHGVTDCRRLAACLQETMRLWPTTPMLSRETTREVEWDGVKLPAGTQCLLVNTFNHRDSTRHEYADRFAPDEWLSGDAASSWTFNHLSHGPQGCPGSDLAIFVGVAVLAQVLHRHTPRLHAPNLSLKPPLPHSLDYFAIKLALDARDG